MRRCRTILPYPCRRSTRLLASTTLLAVATALGGCQTTGLSDVTGSIGNSSASMDAAAAAKPSDAYAARYRANPADADAALKYGQALRAQGQNAQAVAVFEQAAIANPDNKELLGAYGRALADAGQYQQAFDTLSRAHTPDNPDWRILSAQGTALDQLGRHDEARRYYLTALKITPDEPQVLSNLGMSYVLTKDLAKAESTLKRAYDRAGQDARIRQNYALVVGLQGRFQEAEAIASADLPPEQAAANVAYLKQMLSRQEQRKADSSARTSDPRS
jgi:Flp pilus assembly protein TadD